MKGYNSDYGGGGSSSDGSVNGEDFNSAGSNSVGQVDSVTITADVHSVPTTGDANSVSKNYKDGKLDSERYYDGDGNAYLDIDYSDHGNPKTHPIVPHQHHITWKDGEPHRGKDEEVK